MFGLSLLTLNSVQRICDWTALTFCLTARGVSLREIALSRVWCVRMLHALDDCLPRKRRPQVSAGFHSVAFNVNNISQLYLESFNLKILGDCATQRYQANFKICPESVCFWFFSILQRESVQI